MFPRLKAAINFIRIIDDDEKDYSTTFGCKDTSRKCSRFTKFCGTNKKVQKRCKATCDLCGKLKSCGASPK